MNAHAMRQLLVPQFLASSLANGVARDIRSHSEYMVGGVMLGILVGIPILSIIFGGLTALLGLAVAGPGAPGIILTLGLVGVVCGGLIGGPIIGAI